MRFYFLRFPSVLLLLVSLTCATQGSSLRTRRSVLDGIGNTLTSIGQTMKDTVKTGVDSVFHRYSTVRPETTEPTLESNWNETTPDYRQIIDVPLRCPPNHVIVKNRCRVATRRR